MVVDKRIVWVFYLIASVVAFWYWHPDEHYQVSEFASYKLGITPLKHLPWEFHNTMRSGILPYISFLISKFTMSLGVFNPFLTEAICRILSTILLSEEFQMTTPRYYQWSLFFWVLPIVMIRFSSESVSASLFWLGYALFRQNLNKSSLKLFGIGILWGLAFYIRAHIGILIGIAILYHFIKERKFKIYIFILLGFFVSTGLESIVNYWLYGKFVFVPIWYFKVNLLDGQASAKFGTEPFYYYFLEIIKNLIYPIGLAVFIGLFYFSKTKIKSIYTWFIIIFFFIHSVIAHKEYRFLFPIYPLLIPIAFIGLHFIKNKLASKFFNVIFCLNIILVPACFLIHSFKTYNFLRLYSYTQKEKEITCYKNDIYSLEEGARNNFEKAYFYKSKKSTIIIIDSLNKVKTTYLITTKSLGENTNLNKANYQLLFQTIPEIIREKLPEKILTTIDEIYLYQKMAD
jgi:phosphatidylinositol glycan class B